MSCDAQSTVVNLLENFYEPQRGQILVRAPSLHLSLMATLGGCDNGMAWSTEPEGVGFNHCSLDPVH